MATIVNKAKAPKDAVYHYKGDDGVVVSIPAEDLLGRPHPGARINNDVYEAGKTYVVDADHAIEIERILIVYNEGVQRELLSKVNKKALAQLQRSPASAGMTPLE